MTELEYQKWKRNGNFTLSHARILHVSNDIAEGITENYTKKEAAEVATYHAMEVSTLVNEVAHLRTMGALAIGQKMIEQVEQEKWAQESGFKIGEKVRFTFYGKNHAGILMGMSESNATVKTDEWDYILTRDSIQKDFLPRQLRKTQKKKGSVRGRN